MEKKKSNSSLLEKIKSYYNNIEIDHLNKNKIEINSGLQFSYGTSGFRTIVRDLDIVALRIPIITFIRSLNIGLPVGIMISASHCDFKSNGFKIADINGKMLDKEWEKIYEKVINSKNFLEDISSIIDEKVSNNLNFNGKVLIGYDTRESSYIFANLISKCLKEIEAAYENYGLVTTPQLHFLTYLCQQEILDIKNYQRICNINKKYISNVENNVKRIEKNVLTTFSNELYFLFIKDMIRSYTDMFFKVFKNHSYKNEEKLIIDVANGIGGVKSIRDNIEILLNDLFFNFGKSSNENNEMIDKKIKQIEFINTEIDNYEKLNHKSGSDYIQMDQKFPENYKEYKNSETIIKSCAFDGDGDRLIYL